MTVIISVLDESYLDFVYLIGMRAKSKRSLSKDQELKNIHFPYSYYVNLPNPNPNAVVKHQVNIRAVGKIGFIQGTDYVEQGTGGLVWVDGGLGHSNGTLWLESGVGEELRFSILVYIEISSLNDI